MKSFPKLISQIALDYDNDVTNLLKRAFEKVSKELTDSEQDELARRLLKAIEADERRWDDLFAKSQDKLSRLAARARERFKAGETDLLDPEKL